MGNLFFARGQLDRALAYLGKVPEYIQGHRRPRRLWPTKYQSLARVYMAQGETARAEEFIAPSAGPRTKPLDRLEGLGLEYGTLGQIYLQTERFDEAESLNWETGARKSSGNWVRSSKQRI